MPRRTTEFQHLISTIEGLLAHAKLDTAVTESEELVDKITGDKREVDIVIRARAGPRDIIISIECTGDEGSRPATVEWVERMWGKHQSLPTDKLVLVSRAGFTSAAKKKAAWLGIDAHSLRQAEKVDWESEINTMEFYTWRSGVIPHLTQVNLTIMAEADLVSLGFGSLNDTVLYNSDGLPISSLDEILNDWITSRDFTRKVDELAFENRDTLISFEYLFKRGEYITDVEGGKFKVIALKVAAKCRNEVILIPLEHSTYGEVAVAKGSGTSMGLGAEVLVVQEPNSPPKMRLHVPPLKDGAKPPPARPIAPSASWQDLSPRTFVFDFDLDHPDIEPGQMTTVNLHPGK